MYLSFSRQPLTVCALLHCVGGAGELGNGPARRSNSTTPQYGRRAELTANQDSEMQGGGGAAAALGIGGNWDQNTFPKEYHAKPANRAPPDAGQMLKNARHDPNMPAVGACTAASGPASPPARAPLNSDQQLSSLRLTDTSYRRARRARPGEMLQQAERELAQKQLELDRLAQEMGEQGSRGIVAGHFGRNATTQAASHTGGVAATYLNREAGEPSSRDGGGGSGGGGAGRVAGVRDDKGGQGGVAGFDTTDLKREGLGHNFGRVNRMREPESDAGKALNHVVRARPLQSRSGLPSTSMRFFLSLTAKCFRVMQGYTPTWKASQGQPRPSPAALAAVSDYPGWHNSEASRPQHVGRGGFTTGGQENEVDAPRNGGGGGGGGGPGTERKNGGKQMSGILGGDWQGGGTEHRLAPQLYELHPGVSVPVERPMHGGALAGAHTQTNARAHAHKRMFSCGGRPTP